MPVLFLAALVAGNAVDPDEDLPRVTPAAPAHVDVAAHRPYDGAVVCGIGASLGAVAGALSGGVAAAVVGDVAARVLPQTAGAPVNQTLSVATITLLPIGTVAGAAMGGAYGGDRDHPTASVVAGGVGGAAALVVATGAGLAVLAVTQRLPPPNPAVLFVEMGGSIVVGAAFVSTAGLTAGLLAPALSSDTP